MHLHILKVHAFNLWHEHMWYCTNRRQKYLPLYFTYGAAKKYDEVQFTIVT